MLSWTQQEPLLSLTLRPRLSHCFCFCLLPLPLRPCTAARKAREEKMCNSQRCPRPKRRGGRERKEKEIQGSEYNTNTCDISQLCWTKLCKLIPPNLANYRLVRLGFCSSWPSRPAAASKSEPRGGGGSTMNSRRDLDIRGGRHEGIELRRNYARYLRPVELPKHSWHSQILSGSQPYSGINSDPGLILSKVPDPGLFPRRKRHAGTMLSPRCGERRK